MHNHTSQLLFVRSGFIISHFEMAAKFSPTHPPSSARPPRPPIMIIQTPGSVEFDFVCPVSHNSLLLSGQHANDCSVCLLPLFCTVSAVFQFMQHVLAANECLATER